MPPRGATWQWSARQLDDANVAVFIGRATPVGSQLPRSLRRREGMGTLANILNDTNDRSRARALWDGRKGLATFVSNTVVKETGVKDEGKRARVWPKGGVVITSSHKSHSRANSVSIAVRGSGRVPPLGGMGISKEVFIPPSSQGRLLPKFPIVHPKVHTYQGS